MWLLCRTLSWNVLEVNYEEHSDHTRHDFTLIMTPRCVCLHVSVSVHDWMCMRVRLDIITVAGNGCCFKM